MRWQNGYVLVFDLSGKLVKKQDIEVFPGRLIDLAMSKQVPGLYQVKILLKDIKPLVVSYYFIYIILFFSYIKDAVF
ncbi:hypothetical protein [Haliscomenobacter sp.]|uniref:hypothetical protein n=1 Tax=Haliscomenobacter sp. TaxID=2717303 RepID=UPI003BAC4CCF